jgi:two-component system sensor histidine kinase BaeS
VLRSLRSRFVLSHVLPLAIIIPVMGVALIYVLETQVLLGVLSGELEDQAELAARVAAERPTIWHNPEQAHTFVTEVGADLSTRVMLIDTGGHLLASNEASDDERLGQPLQVDGLEIALAGDISVRSAYSRHMQKEIVDVLAPVLGQGGDVVGVVRLSHRLVNVYEQFLRLRYLIGGVLVVGLLHRLLSLEQARRQLLSNLVHELGRPLGAFRSATQALLGRSGEDAELRQELLVGMDAEIDRLGRLLDDLSGLHDQVLGTLELNRQPTDLGAWLRQMLPPWREAAQAQGLKWKTSLPPDLPTVNVDPMRLSQVVGNLLSNAIKYTPPQGTVTLSVGADEQEAWIRVSDTGRGITPEEQERIFAPFYRSQPGRRFPQGMGLGLSIAYTLVAAHGGRLEVDSTPGLGSHFTVRLPLRIQTP